MIDPIALSDTTLAGIVTAASGARITVAAASWPTACVIGATPWNRRRA